MPINIVQASSPIHTGFTNSANLTLNGVAAGNALVAIAGASNRPLTISDGVNTWTKRIEGNDGVDNNPHPFIAAALNVPGGNYTVTVASDNGSSVLMGGILIEVNKAVTSSPDDGTPAASRFTGSSGPSTSGITTAN